jgi:hypothetical protein
MSESKDELQRNADSPDDFNSSTTTPPAHHRHEPTAAIVHIPFSPESKSDA